MDRQHRLATSTLVAALVGAAGTAGSALAAFSLNPPDFIMWGGAGIGRPVNGAPAGYTWANSSSGSALVGSCIDANGRVYYVGAFQSTPTVGTIALNNTKGLFTATNSTDSSVFMDMADNNSAGWGITGTSPLMNPGNSTHTLSGIGSSAGNLRVSGTNVDMGVQVNGTGIVESGTGQNNSVFYSGNMSGISAVALRNDSITLSSLLGGTAPGAVNIDYRAVTNQGQDLDSSGTSLLALTVTADNTNFKSTAGTGNNSCLATKTVGGAYNVIAQGDGSAPGVAGGTYYNGSQNSVGDFYDRLNRNEQVAYAARLNDSGFVTTTNDRVAYIYTPGTSSYSMFYRTGDTAYGIGGQAFTSGAIQTSARNFSTAGVLYATTLTGSDIVTTSGSSNAQAVYLGQAVTAGVTNTDRATNNTLVIRQNSSAPAYNITTNTTSSSVNTFNGAVNTSSMSMNNNGFIAMGEGLQGSDVIKTVAVQNDFGSPAKITVPGTQGNDQAILVGTVASGFQMLMRNGDPAPFFTGQYISMSVSGLNMCINNSNQILFLTGLTAYAAGQQVGNVGDLLSSIGSPFGNVLWGWQPGLATPYPVLYGGQVVQVDPGVYKTISTFGVNASWNGDGGVEGFNDNGQFIVNVSFTDSTYGLLKLTVPAPGTGALCMLGLTALASRRRR